MAGGGQPQQIEPEDELPVELPAPAELTPRSRKRKAVKEAKAKAKLKDPVAFRAKRAEQERNRLQNKEAREAAAADAARSVCIAPLTPSAAAFAPAPPLSTIGSGGIFAASGLAGPTPPPLGDATFHLSLPYGLCPPPPSPIPPPILPPATLPSAPLAPLAPSNPPSQPPTTALQIKIDRRTFEQKKIKGLQLKIDQLEAAVATRDQELKAFADSLQSAVKNAMQSRDAMPDRSDLSVPLSLRLFPHDPENRQCTCACCLGLSFLALPLAQRAAYLERMRADEAG